MELGSLSQNLIKKVNYFLSNYCGLVFSVAHIL